MRALFDGMVGGGRGVAVTGTRPPAAAPGSRRGRAPLLGACSLGAFSTFSAFPSFSAFAAFAAFSTTFASFALLGGLLGNVEIGGGRHALVERVLWAALDVAVLGTRESTEAFAAGLGAVVDDAFAGPGFSCGSCVPAGGPEQELRLVRRAHELAVACFLVSAAQLFGCLALRFGALLLL